MILASGARGPGFNSRSSPYTDDSADSQDLPVCFVDARCHDLTMRSRQFAREVKGVDLRSTAGNCAWVRTPQLAFSIHCLDARRTAPGGLVFDARSYEPSGWSDRVLNHRLQLRILPGIRAIGRVGGEEIADDARVFYPCGMQTGVGLTMTYHARAVSFVYRRQDLSGARNMFVWSGQS